MLRRRRLTVEQQALLDAAALSDSLNSGGRLQPISGSITLPAGELLYAQAEVECFQHVPVDIDYREPGLFVFGDPDFVAGALLTALFLRHRRRRQLKKLAAPQWRSVDSGTLYLTSRRLVLQGQQGWVNFWFQPTLRESQLDSKTLSLSFDDAPPTRFVTPEAPRLFVLLRRLVNHETASIKVPKKLRKKARRLPR
ncbi:MAG: hypothetical protein ACRDMH_07060 [Solirubrobacterales bacterium]